jgi:hypothetical protein
MKLKFLLQTDSSGISKFNTLSVRQSIINEKLKTATVLLATDYLDKSHRKKQFVALLNLEIKKLNLILNLIETPNWKNFLNFFGRI